MAESNIKLIVDASQANNALKSVNNQTKAVTKSVNVLGSALKAIPFIGVAEAARRFFAGFAEADKAAAAVQTLGVNSEKLRSQLLAVSNQTKGLASQTELLKASYDVASAGFNDAAAAANILKAATFGAVGGLSDINTVADATTSVLNAYGLASDKAAKIVDGFIQTQNDGKIVVAQYASQIGRVAPIAAAAGVGIEDLNAAISAVTATGVPVESTFSGLRQAIASVIKPTDEARKTAELLGLEFNSAAIKTQGFGGFLESVIEKTGGSEVALTKLFGSVEAVATIIPLANDGLEKFNASLDNQKTSAGAAEKAAQDLGGTVSTQVGSIIKNIGNVARALDTVLGPAIKNIVTRTNEVISAFSTAIQKFNDLTTGQLDQASARFQFLNKVLFGNAEGLKQVKNAVELLNPAAATSTDQLDNMQGALNRAGNAARLIGPNAAEGMQKLALEVQGSIRAVEALIKKRRELLAQSGDTQATTKEDPELVALRQRVNDLLKQLDTGPSTGQERVDMSQKLYNLNKQLLDSDTQLTDLQKLGLEYQIDKQEILDRGLKPREQEVALLEAQNRFESSLANYRDEQLRKEDAATKKLRDRLKAQQDADRKRLEADPGFQMQQELDQLLKAQTQVQAGAIAIGNAFANSFTAIVSGAKTGKEALADMMSAVAEHFLDMAKQIIAKQLTMILYGTITNALGVTGGDTSTDFPTIPDNEFPMPPPPPRANGGPVMHGQPYMVGERGPELFIPFQSGQVVSNEDSEDMLSQAFQRGSTSSINNSFQQLQSVNLPFTRTSERIEAERQERQLQTAVDNPQPIDVRFESQSINNVEYVTAEQHRQGMVQAAEQGRSLTLVALQNSVKTRRKVGL